MRARMIGFVVILAVALGTIAVGSLGCGNSTEPEGVCDTLHLSNAGRDLWGSCCGSMFLLVGYDGSRTTGCRAEGCEGSWEITVERGADGVITSYTAVYTSNGRRTTCRGP